MKDERKTVYISKECWEMLKTESLKRTLLNQGNHSIKDILEQLINNDLKENK